jgi:hypothetical protein
MSPSNHILSAPDTPASLARPWGLHHLVAPTTATKHEGGSDETSETTNDGNGPNEEMTKD